MNTQTVAVQTARLLAAAGFPQPAPAPGQWWADNESLIFIFRPWVDDNHDYFIIAQTVAGGRPIIDDYFDARDFRGLVYLPTVGDILNAIPDYCIVFDDSQMPAGFTCYDTLRRIADQYPVTHKHHAEAAALAYLSIHEKSKTQCKTK